MSIILSYVGQIADLRKFAIERLGLENAGVMTDRQIEDVLESEGFITLKEDDEVALLINKDDIDGLVERGKAAWLER